MDWLCNLLGLPGPVGGKGEHGSLGAKGVSGEIGEKGTLEHSVYKESQVLMELQEHKD